MNDTPPIRYAETADGLQIAYWTLGDGLPILWCGDIGHSHAARVWERSELRSHFETLSERFTVVYFDPRNHGLSTRGVHDLSIADHMLDIRAVLDAVGASEAGLYAQGDRAKVAVAFAATEPQRVAFLTLAHPVLGAVDDAPGHSEIGVVYPLVKTDWQMYTEVASTIYTGLSDPSLTAWNAEYFRSSVTVDDYRHVIAAVVSADVSELLGEVSAPVLVVSAESPWLGTKVPLTVASMFSKVEVVHVAGKTVYSALPPTARALAERFGTDRTGAEPSPGGFQTVMFTDLESSTALTQRLGDEGAQELLRSHNDAVRTALEANGGREVKHTGDGIMASFSSAVSAATAALHIQRDLAGAEIRVRIGVNAGEPIAEDGDLFGTAVQLAARITDRAEPGQVLVSDVVRQLCAGKAFEFTPMGAASLKGIDEPVALFEVHPA